MAVEIKNQKNKYVCDVKIREEILDAADNNMIYTCFEGTKIDIISDLKTDNGRLIKVNVEGIYD